MTFTERTLSLAALTSALLFPTLAGATTLTFGGTSVAGQGVFSSVAGATTVDFESGEPANYSGGQVVSGNVGGVYATPADDQTHYFVTNVGSASVVLNQASTYFGIYWGTLDTYNTIALTSASGTDTYTGSQISILSGVPANGAQSVYVNFFSGNNPFTKIVLTSTQQNFESDNHAFLSASATPEPSTWALLLGGVALMSVPAVRRLRKN